MKDGVVSENTARTLGKEAQRNNILAAKIVADIVKTTLGPKGMDKMIVDGGGNVTVTNDGVTILNELDIDHPAGKIIVEIAKVQEKEVGDGTTTVVMLAGKLLENAEKLIDKRIHPTVIVKGYKLASERALKGLDEIAINVDSSEVLKKIAMTAMTGKGAEGNREKLAELIVGAVMQIATGNEIDIEDVKIEKIKGEATEGSELVQGIVLDKEFANSEMPRFINDAKIALIDFPLELKGPEIETKISVSSPEQLRSFMDAEENMLRDIVQKIINSGAKFVFCQKGIDDVAQYYLARAGVSACRRVSRSDMEKLARATSGRIVSNINELAGNFGFAKSVSEKKVGEETMTFVEGCNNPRAVTLLVKGATEHVVDEVERAVHDGLGDVVAAVRKGKFVVGGGAVEIALARKIREFSRTLSGREQLAVEEFANALECVPETLAENAGLDPIDVIGEIRHKQANGNNHFGLNLFTDKVEDCLAAGILEPLKVKTQAITSATEVSALILRVDDVLVSGRQQQKVNPLEGMD